MNLIIHRGTQEIGGSCVELRTHKSRILIDFGLPLVSAGNKPFDIKDLPKVKGLYKNEAKGIDAILLSHSHLDHYGLLSHVREDITIYMSRGAKELIEISSIFTPHKLENINSQTVSAKKPFNIDDIKITPYLVDHSAFDALAFLVEADGKRLFYSGDFRGHGRKSALFSRMIKDPPKGIDCLLMEGSMIGRDAQSYKTEIDVQKSIEKTLLEGKKITFISMSSQNIDRIVSAYKACLKTDSIFVIDIYTAFILDKLKKISKNIPQFDWKDMRVMYFYHHAEALARAGHKDLLYIYNKRKIKAPEINLSRKRFLIMARDNSIFPVIIRGLNNISGSKIIYSMWEGYLTPKFIEYCTKRELVIEKVHTSGHATIRDLKAFATAINPKALIPIHTFHASRYAEFFKNVKVLKDGEEVTL